MLRRSSRTRAATRKNEEDANDYPSSPRPLRERIGQVAGEDAASPPPSAPMGRGLLLLKMMKDRGHVGQPVGEVRRVSVLSRECRFTFCYMYIQTEIF